MGARKKRRSAMRRDPENPKKHRVGFRATDAMLAFLVDRARYGKVTVSDIVREGSEMHQDMFDVLGAEWHEVRRQAAVAGESMGTVLGRLVRESLKRDRRNNHNG